MSVPDPQTCVIHAASTAVIHKEELDAPSSCLSSSTSPIILEIKPTPRRWVVLFAVAFFGIANIIADSQNSILHTMVNLLDLSVNSYVYYGLIFTYVPLLTNFPCAWAVDKFGIKPALYCAAFGIFIKAIFRVLLFLPNLAYWHELKLFYWICSNVIAMQILVFVYNLPLTISETWFTEKERATAWAILFCSSLVGGSVAALMYPRLVAAYYPPTVLLYANVICSISAILVILIFITRSKPKHPPNQRTILNSDLNKDTQWQTIKKMFRHKDLLLNSIHIAFYDGIIIAIGSVQQDILIASGHSKIFIGNLLALDNLVGLVMLIALSPLVHKFTDIVFVCKFGSASKTLIFLVLAYVMVYPFSDWTLLILSVSYTIWRSWVLPNFNNMTAHVASGYLSEASATSLQTTIIILTITINQLAFMFLRREDSQKKPDYTYSMLFAGVAAIVNSSIYIIFFKGKQKRMEDTVVNNEYQSTSDSRIEEMS